MPRCPQRGFGLVEVLVAAGISVALMAFTLSVKLDNRYALEATVTEDRLGAVADSLQAYLDDNSTALAQGSAVAGFVNPMSPAVAELQAAHYLATYYPAHLPLGGQILTTIRLSPNGDLLGLVYGSNTVNQYGQPSPRLALQISGSLKGRGLCTSTQSPTVLSGVAFQGVASPISGTAIVAAWAFTPNPM